MRDRLEKLAALFTSASKADRQVLLRRLGNPTGKDTLASGFMSALPGKHRTRLIDRLHAVNTPLPGKYDAFTPPAFRHQLSDDSMVLPGRLILSQSNE